MTRLPVTLFALALASCTLKSSSPCPDEYTPNDQACAWHYCQDHHDARCSDASASLDASQAQPDASRADAASDAREDAQLVQPACKSVSDCTSAQPFCSASGACVQCTDDTQCPASSPACSAGVCSKCASSSACARHADAPVCEPVQGSCVACTSAEPTACVSAGTVCKSSATTCVECNTNAECKRAEAARCTANACTSCQGDSDCQQETGKPVCHAGRCVACTPASEALRCGETSCDPETFTCTSTKRASLATCALCRADSECLADRKCVKVPFMGMDTGFHCMLVATNGCSNPYRGTPLTAVSRSGAGSAQYCAQNTGVTTCEATIALTSDKPCTSATVQTDCGSGARCEAVNAAANRCTYACSSDLVCPIDAPCNEQSSPNPYCGGPAP